MRLSWKFVVPLLVWLAFVLVPHPAGISGNGWNIWASLRA